MTKQLSVEEANEICAKYLGYYNKPIYGKDYWHTKEGKEIIFIPRFDKDLNLLMPIWDSSSSSIMIYIGAMGGFRIETPFTTIWDDDLENLTKKVCIATAKSILDI